MCYKSECIPAWWKRQYLQILEVIRSDEVDPTFKRNPLVHTNTFQQTWWMSLNGCVSIFGEIWDTFTGFPAGKGKEDPSFFFFFFFFSSSKKEPDGLLALKLSPTDRPNKNPAAWEPGDSPLNTSPHHLYVMAFMLEKVTVPLNSEWSSAWVSWQLDRGHTEYRTRPTLAQFEMF